MSSMSAIMHGMLKEVAKVQKPTNDTKTNDKTKTKKNN